MKKYWSILWRFLLCNLLVSSVFQQLYASDERFIKLDLTFVFLCHGLFFFAALRARTHKFSQGFWRDLYDADALKAIYLVFISGAFLMAMLNMLVAELLSTDAWVDFKIFGTFIYALLLPGVALGMLAFLTPRSAANSDT